MTNFSHSRIGTFETCPLQYKYNYIDKVKVEQEDTVETFLGDKVHQALAKLYKDLKFEKLLSLKELLEFFNKLWKENWNDTVKINRKEYTDENYRKMGERFLTDYYNRFKPFNQGKVIGLETTDFLNLNEDGSYKFHIRIDRLMDMGNGLYEVHDYKTNNSLTKQEYLDKDRQLAMYSLWVKKQYKDLKKVKLVWHFLAFDKDMESSRTAEELEDLREEVLVQIKEIENTSDFKAKVSKLCDWCKFMGLCPMHKHEVSLEEKKVNEFLEDSGVKLVNEYANIKMIKKELEEKENKLKEALIEFCKKEGVNVVVGSNNKVSVKDYEKIIIPEDKKEELVKLLKEKGLYEEYSSYNYSILNRKIINKEIDEDIANLTEKEKAYRLSLSKRRD